MGELKTIQAKIDDLNEHATAAQKIARQAAAQATQDATVAANQAQAAEAAAEHAKSTQHVRVFRATAAQIKKASTWRAASAEAEAKKISDRSSSEVFLPPSRKRRRVPVYANCLMAARQRLIYVGIVNCTVRLPKQKCSIHTFLTSLW